MYLEGDALKMQYLHHGFQKGWNILGRYYDKSDPEWSLWRSRLGLHLSLCLTHVTLSQACRLMKCPVKVQMGLLVLFDLACLCAILGPKVIIYMVLKTGLVWISSKVGGVLGVWGLLGIEMLACNLPAFNNAQDSFLGLSDNTRHQVKLSFASANCTLELKDICKNIVRILLWVLFLEVSLHFLYFSALAYNSALKHLSLWALVAVGQSTGQFFMVKYVIFYGLGGQLGRFDGIVPPPEPRCISWVYSFTDMWKYFDTGLYNFIKVYVYIPLGGSRHGLVRQLAASGVVFLFIYVWHGGTYVLFVWCLGNYLVGSLEGIACAFEKCSAGQKLVSVTGHRMMLRIKCLLFAPAYLASCLQTFYFLFHMQEAWEIAEHILLKSTWTQFGILMGIFYTCIHNAMFIRNRVCKHKKNIYQE
ncbi:hypothetical protein RRG08_003407 [Elysia crispata]|uniref:Uncharacterized protein n=1 Tax=Elysia crispata TaxID=231223 RepID=A0AAE1AB21_9GAST|nr:hypothetical protein RRG08_003407 [Elysia crispata]